MGTSSFWSFSILGERLDRPLDVGLEDEVKVLERLLRHLAVEVLECDRLPVGVGEVPRADAAGLGDLTGVRDVVGRRQRSRRRLAPHRGPRLRRVSMGRPRRWHGPGR